MGDNSSINDDDNHNPRREVSKRANSCQGLKYQLERMSLKSTGQGAYRVTFAWCTLKPQSPVLTSSCITLTKDSALALLVEIWAAP